jgi:hypothetical protein
MPDNNTMKVAVDFAKNEALFISDDVLKKLIGFTPLGYANSIYSLSQLDSADIANMDALSFSLFNTYNLGDKYYPNVKSCFSSNEDLFSAQNPYSLLSVGVLNYTMYKTYVYINANLDYYLFEIVDGQTLFEIDNILSNLTGTSRDNAINNYVKDYEKEVLSIVNPYTGLHEYNSNDAEFYGDIFRNLLKNSEGTTADYKKGFKTALDVSNSKLWPK